MRKGYPGSAQLFGRPRTTALCAGWEWDCWLGGRGSGSLRQGSSTAVSPQLQGCVIAVPLLQDSAMHFYVLWECWSEESRLVLSRTFVRSCSREMLDFHADQDLPFQLILHVLPCFQFNRKLNCCFYYYYYYYFPPSVGMPCQSLFPRFPFRLLAHREKSRQAEVGKADRTVQHILCLVQLPSSPSTSNACWPTQAL